MSGSSKTQRRPPPGRRNADEGGFGRRLRELRDRVGLTQREVAERLRMTQSMVAQYEGGYLRLHAALLVRLTEVLKVTPNDILGVSSPASGQVTRNRRLLRRLSLVDELPLADQRALLRFLDATLRSAGIAVPTAASRQRRSRMPVAAKRARSSGS